MLGQVLLLQRHVDERARQAIDELLDLHVARDADTCSGCAAVGSARGRPVGCEQICLPTASWPGQNCRAAASLTIATELRSVAVGGGEVSARGDRNPSVAK